MYMLTRTRSEYRGMKMGIIAFSEFFLFSLQFFVCRHQNDDHKDKSAVSAPFIYGGQRAGKRERECKRLGD